MNETKAGLSQAVAETAKEMGLKGYPRNEKGQFVTGVKPDGRPKGAISQFTALKHDFLRAWKDGKGTKRFQEMIENGTKRDFLECARLVFSLLPRELKAELSGTGTGVNIVVIRSDERQVGTDYGTLTVTPSLDGELIPQDNGKTA